MKKSSVVVLVIDSLHCAIIEKTLKKYAQVDVVVYTTRESVPVGTHIDCVLVSKVDIEQKKFDGEKFFFKKIQDECQPDTSIFVLLTNSNFGFFDRKKVINPGRKEYTTLHKGPFLSFFISPEENLEKTKKLLAFVLTGSEEIPHRVEG